MSKISTSYRLACACIVTSLLLSGCGDETRARQSRARDEREEITVYCGVSPDLDVSLSEELFEQFALATNVQFDLIQFGPQRLGSVEDHRLYAEVDWYARCSPACEPTDILDNLDLLHENTNFNGYNPVYKRSKPDLIVASRLDEYIHAKAEDGYFIDADEVLEAATVFHMAHSEAFWQANRAATDDFAIPLYSFSIEDPTGLSIPSSGKPFLHLRCKAPMNF